VAAHLRHHRGRKSVSTLWMVNGFKDTVFLPKPAEEKQSFSFGLRDSLIMWGSPAQILTSDGRLRPEVFEVIREDLTDYSHLPPHLQDVQLPAVTVGAKRRRTSGNTSAAAACAASDAASQVSVQSARKQKIAMSAAAAAPSAAAATAAAAAAAVSRAPLLRRSREANFSPQHIDTFARLFNKLGDAFHAAAAELAAGHPHAAASGGK
jgi:hypothetical protein